MNDTGAEVTATTPAGGEAAPDVKIDMVAALADIDESLGMEDEGALKLPAEKVEGKPSDKGVAPVDKPAASVDTPEADADYPSTWRAEVKPHWKDLKPEVRQQIIEREKHILDGINGYKDRADFADAFKKVLGPYTPQLIAQGIHPLQHIGTLLDTYTKLANPQTRAAAVQDLFKRLSINPEEVGFTPDEAPAVDPAVQSLRSELDTIKSGLSAQNAARYEEARKQVTSEIEAFSKDPKHSHFNEVANDIALLVKSKACKTLAEAYETACYRNPVVRQKVIDAQRKEADVVAAKEAEEKTRQAKEATAANLKSNQRRSSVAKDPEGSLDDTLNETLRNIKARG